MKLVNAINSALDIAMETDSTAGTVNQCTKFVLSVNQFLVGLPLIAKHFTCNIHLTKNLFYLKKLLPDIHERYLTA